MKGLATHQQTLTRAVIYARVSSTAQVTRGHGLGSQETRCRDYARHKHYEIAEVFRDEGVSGGLIDRPGMQAMLSYLRTQKKRGAAVVVLIDDISRLARDIKAHLDLRSAIGDAGGKLESPSIEFGEDSDSILVENLLASVSQHQRQKNAEQVVNRMRARVMNGYYVFAPVLGYSFAHVPSHGKMIVPDQDAPIVKEALEGFAAGRFQSPSEVRRFLESIPTTPRNARGEVRLQYAIDLLERSLYAGYITVPKWGIVLHPGKHEPIIAFSTWQRIQERLSGKANAPARKDTNAAFPLRGFVACAGCGHPMTGAWSKGRNGHYAYYFCHNRDCGSYRKSVRREEVEGQFETLLQSLQPTPALFRAALAMFTDLWEARLQGVSIRKDKIKKEMAALESKTSQIMDRLLQADSHALITAYENQVRKLEEQRIALTEELERGCGPVKSFDEMFRTACAFLANPWKLWASGVLEHRRTLLRLAFPGRVAFCRIEGFRTAEIALPFRVLGQLGAPKCKLVGPPGLEPGTNPL
jgi:site-specific DNA recombinase